MAWTWVWMVLKVPSDPTLLWSYDSVCVWIGFIPQLSLNPIDLLPAALNSEFVQPGANCSWVLICSLIPHSCSVWWGKQWRLISFLDLFFSGYCFHTRCFSPPVKLSVLFPMCDSSLWPCEGRRGRRGGWRGVTMNAVGSTGVQPCRSVTVEFLALPSMLFNQLSLASYLHILIKLHEMNKKEAFVFFTLFQL